MLVTSILSFPTMFLIQSATEIIILATLNLSSADAFNFTHSKMLSVGKEKPLPVPPIKDHENKSFRKHIVLKGKYVEVFSFNLDQSKMLSSGNGLKFPSYS